MLILKKFLVFQIRSFFFFNHNNYYFFVCMFCVYVCCHSFIIPKRKKKKKLVDLCAWHQALGCDMWWAYSTILTPEQRQRAQTCEFLDELEEWKLIMQHYCIVVACTTEAGLDFCQAGPLLGLDASKCQLRTKKK